MKVRIACKIADAPAAEVTLEFGEQAPDLYKQIGVGADELAAEQELADAIALCARHGLSTERERRYLFKRVAERIRKKFPPPPKLRPQITRWIPASAKEGPLPAFAARWLPASDTPLGRWIGRLSERQLCVLDHRLAPEKPTKTLAVIGKEYGVTGSCIQNEERYLYRCLFGAACGSYEHEGGIFLRFQRRDATYASAMYDACGKLQEDLGVVVPVGDPHAEKCRQALLDEFPQAGSWTERERGAMRTHILWPKTERNGWWVLHSDLLKRTTKVLTAHLSPNGRISDLFVGQVLAELKIAPRYQRAWVERVGGFRREENGWAVQ